MDVRGRVGVVRPEVVGLVPGRDGQRAIAEQVLVVGRGLREDRPLPGEHPPGVVEHRPDVVQRLGLDGLDGELLGQLVGSRGELRGRHPVQRGLRGPDVGLRDRPFVRRHGVAQEQLAGRDLAHLVAFGERHHPRVQEHAGAVGHRELAVLDLERPRVGEHREQAHHDGGRDPLPADPPDDHVNGEHGQQRQGDRAQEVADAEQQADEHASPHRRLRVPQQQRDRQREHEQERDVGQDQVLELDPEPVVEQRHGGQGGQPGGRAEPVPGQRVDHDRDRQRHQVLQNRYDGVGVKHLEQLQPE